MTDKSEGLLATVKHLGVSIAVSNLEATARWYKEQLGFEEVLRREFPEFGTRIVFIETNGVRIELIEDKNWHPINRPDPPQHTSIQGVSQITFKVDDIQTAIARVKSRPIKIAWDLVIVKDIGFKEFFIRDNEGNIIQFLETFEPIH
jgi:predicted enzyme related to lactoylglutathione lyase